MVRPNFIVGEPEPGQALSARKLVIETAKFNVITGYSAEEFLELVERFPNVDAVVVHRRLMRDDEVGGFLERVREFLGAKPIILLSPNASTGSWQVDYEVNSHQPEELVELLRERFGDPREITPQRELTSQEE